LWKNFLAIFVNDSEYSQSAGAKPIFSPSCIYLVSPGALRAQTPPRPPFWGREVPKKRKSPVTSALAVGHVCVGVGEVSGALGVSRLCYNYFIFIFLTKKNRNPWP
jgi:hypothetical protein